MRFIRKSTFNLLPESVQYVFLNWWKPTDGDLFWWNQDRFIDCCDDSGFMGNEDINNLKEYDDITPLFTEGQLRKFIEDKTGGKVEFYPDVYNGERFYTIMIRASGCGGDDPEFEVDADDVLQAYWKLAVLLAESEVK